MGRGRLDDRHRQPVGSDHLRAPWRFEAGTPNTGRTSAWGCFYVSSIGLDAIREYEQMLMHYALQELASVPELTPAWPGQPAGCDCTNLGNTMPMTWAVSSITMARPCVQGTTVPCR